MGKKVKVGKQRRDKYYRLAKEAGYRSRAAFKLIQLNKRFEFLQNSRAVVDLCAAPGGWMQVASQNMPVSSLCIGVDLAPIKPIPHCIALQGDITIEKTRQAIKKELQSWEADTVLHDGAPNVGQNWIHDAFQQNLLTLSALKLATQILRRGGTFVTKVFRSNDYQCLITVFEKLFKKVHVWKPAASRLESAEIFVVCEKYQRPGKVEPELLDPKKVFLNPNLEPKIDHPSTLFLTKKKEKKAKAEGYADGEVTLHKSIPASTFVDAPNYLELLGTTSRIELDGAEFDKAEETTEEVRECLKDIKLCGPRELRLIVNWRKKMRSIREEKRKAEEPEEEETEEVPLNEDDEEDKELAAIDAEIARASADEKTALKKKKKKMLKEKQKVLRRKQLKMIIEGDEPDIPTEEDLFSLAKINKAKQLATVLSGKEADKEKEDDDEAMDEEDKEEEGLGEGDWETRGDDEEDDEEANELIHTEDSYLTEEQRKNRNTSGWFAKDEIAGLLGDEDEDDEGMRVIEKFMDKKKGTIREGTVAFTKEREEEEEKEGDFDEEKELESDEEYMDEDKRIAARKSEEKKRKAKGEDGEEGPAKKRRLTPEQLAMGEALIYSSKTRRDLEEWGWNRFMNNDEGLPDWFVEDEKKHYRKMLPVTKEQVAEYRERMKEVNARPIKKVAEAKARKHRRAAMRLAKAKKKAENVVDNENLEHSEKIREMKKIYKKAVLKEKKDVPYHVVTKGKRGASARPSGAFKVVDRRMKSDNRKQKATNKKKSWREKSSREKKDAQDKTKKRKSQQKAQRTVRRRTKRGKAS